jgi:hypothetical protein
MKIEEYKELILEHKFFEAHEVLEEFWFPRRRQKDDLTLVIKGFINAAVSFELYRKGRIFNSLKVWQVFEKYVKLLEKIDREDLEELKKFVQEFKYSYIKG